MQPDLLSAEHEEEQPEPVTVLEQAQTGPLPLAETYTPEPISVPQMVQPEMSLPVRKKRAKLNIAVIGLVLLAFLLFLSFAWVGYWAYTLNNELMTTRAQLTASQAENATLQAEYGILKGENDKRNAELVQSRADLDKASSDLAAAQEDLNKAKDQSKSLDTRIDQAGKLSEILFIWTTSDTPSDVFRIDTLINESDDQQLISQWKALTRSPSDDTFGSFMDYLVLAIRNSLK